MSLVSRLGVGRGLLAFGLLVSVVVRSPRGWEERMAAERASLFVSPPRARRRFSAMDWAALRDFLVPNASVRAARELRGVGWVSESESSRSVSNWRTCERAATFLASVTVSRLVEGS